MPRLLVHVEGQTEETFVNELLGPHLVEIGFTSVSARLIGNAESRSKRGGGRAWGAVRDGIVHHLREDRTCIVTTMVDFYGLPADDDRGWPGRADANRRGNEGEKAAVVEEAVLQDVDRHFGHRFDARRFIPFIVMHEFEGLLFSDCAAFGRSLGRPALVAALQSIRDEFLTPEEINDSAETAPSKRVRNLFPEYEKVLSGVAAAQAIGLDRIRVDCPHFAEWLNKLEAAARG